MALMPGYKAPSRWTLSNTYLPKLYEETFSEVRADIDRSATLGIILDESTNVSNDRVLALSVNTNKLATLLRWLI